jgi:hypothetical protein
MYTAVREDSGANHPRGGLLRNLPVRTYVEKTGPGNFLPYAFLVAMGHQNDPLFMSERTVLEYPDIVVLIRTQQNFPPLQFRRYLF